MSLLLGLDVGSSSIKATLMEAETGKVLASAFSPEKELEIIAKIKGWAEQHPKIWWDNCIIAVHKVISQAKAEPSSIKAVGISYQMHGLVVVDKNLEVLRPAIIWCDSRAVEIGRKAASEIGPQKCLKNLLNLPGNFTASKLKWVMDNEPDVYSKIFKIMLPGDYIAMKMTGEIKTTPSGLSEGILWDFKKQSPAKILLDYYGINPDLLSSEVPTFSIQGLLTKDAAQQLGLSSGTPVSYRAGDQPNNALSLNVLNPGEIAATAGTSGVVYGITEKNDYDKKSRVNTFVHVNHSASSPRYGVLLCLNGTGILNSWLKHNATDGLSYPQINDLASKAPIGCDGLVILPYGNGAERTLDNKDIGSSIYNLNFNIHTKSHLLRAAQEGIVFALNYGLQIMHRVGVEIKTVRAGNANMFLSSLFAQAFASVTGSIVELYNTDGAQGAARGAGIGAGIYSNYKEAFVGLDRQKVIEPDKTYQQAYQNAYSNWLSILQSQLGLF